MHYLFMLFLIGGEGTPIESYRMYEQESFQTMEQCVEFYQENSASFRSQAESASNGRFWKLACADEQFKQNLESLRKPSNSLNPNLIFS